MTFSNLDMDFLVKKANNMAVYKYKGRERDKKKKKGNEKGKEIG